MSVEIPEVASINSLKIFFDEIQLHKVNLGFPMTINPASFFLAKSSNALATLSLSNSITSAPRSTARLKLLIRCLWSAGFIFSIDSFFVFIYITNHFELYVEASLEDFLIKIFRRSIISAYCRNYCINFCSFA